MEKKNIVEEKEIVAEETHAKKLDEFKETEENKEALAKADGRSVPAVSKVKAVKDKKVVVAELEREYVIPLRKGFLKAPRYRRAKKAIKIIREFLVRHMRVAERDIKNVKIDMYLNNEVWFRGIKKPMNKIKVKAVKRNGIVYVELADIPEHVKFLMEKEKKAKETAEKSKKKVGKEEHKHEHSHEHAQGEGEDKNADGVDDKVERDEKTKAGAEEDLKKLKAEVKAEKHTATGVHPKKTSPVRKSLKK